ncbi:acyltransferase [uncultured Subdoligranulum sp.]|uniref:acyltransferase n=1 Tax=uncultured Subdoligranulum sp. TaxID=512298 RepID=UPI003208AE45
MNKYGKALFCVPLAWLKYVILKLKHGRDFSARGMAIVSPFTEITQEKGSYLHIGCMLKMHNGAKLRVRHGGTLNIGDRFGMSNGCVVTAYECITIGDDVMLGPNVLIYDQDHDYRVPDGVAAGKYKTTPIEIGNNVWIGANSVILRGTILGDNCVVGAGTILKGKFPPYSRILQKRETEVIERNTENR